MSSARTSEMPLQLCFRGVKCKLPSRHTEFFRARKLVLEL
jgi:hypothetical protein